MQQMLLKRETLSPIPVYACAVTHEIVSPTDAVGRFALLPKQTVSGTCYITDAPER